MLDLFQSTFNVQGTMDDWRLTNQMQYLHRASLQWRTYANANPANDHDHCEFCFAKFMTSPENHGLCEGYATADAYRWICKPCYDDFRTLFDWQLSDSPPSLQPPL